MVEAKQQYRPHSPWKHFGVGVLLAVAAITWGVQYHVLTSIRLDFTGIEVEGKSQLIPDCEIAEYICEFTTKEGEVISGRIMRGSAPKVFVYLANNPNIFKVKDSGLGVQISVAILAILSVWQLSWGVMHFLKAYKK